MTSIELELQIAALAPHVIAVALCAARLLPVVFLCPVLGGEAAPTTVKLGIVLALSMCVHFAGGVVPVEVVSDPLTFGGLVVREFSFGIALGLVASLPFDAGRMGGKFIDLFRGSSAEAALPHAGTRESATGDGLYQLLVALVVTGAVMPLMLKGLFHSYAVVKLGAFVHTESAAIHIVALAGTALGTGLAVGAPIAAAAMAVDCVMGLASRAAPQMNLQDVGSPLKILAGGAVLFLTVGVVAERMLAEVATSDGAMNALMERPVSGEKTEKPSEQKLRDARKKGQIAKSRLFTASIVTFGGLVGLSLSSAPATLKAWTAQLLSTPDLSPATALSQAALVLASVTAPPLICAFLASFAVSVATAGFQVNADHVAPQLERVDPFKGFKKVFSVTQLIEVGKGLLVAAIVAWLVWSGARDAADQVIAGIQQSGELAMLTAISALKPVLMKGAIVLLLLGAGDYWLARRKHLKDLMMSRQDLKQEHKSSEGDPHHKARRKQLHQQISMGGQARGVQKATAVVVNPTHIAIALRYDETECDAPYIVAKGREEDALKIRKQAGELEIPIVKDIPLARTLVNYDVGEEVPEELYQAAAAILKVAMERKAAKDAEAKGGK